MVLTSHEEAETDVDHDVGILEHGVVGLYTTIVVLWPQWTKANQRQPTNSSPLTPRSER